MIHYASHFTHRHHISRIRHHIHAFDITQLITNILHHVDIFYKIVYRNETCFRSTEQCYKDCAREVFKHDSFHRQGKTSGIPQRVVRVPNRPDARRFKQGNFTLLLAVTQCIPHCFQASQELLQIESRPPPKTVA